MNSMKKTLAGMFAAGAVFALTGLAAGQCGGGSSKSYAGQEHEATVIAAKHTKGETIVATAAANPNFTTLVTALKAAGLVDTLNGKGPFTVFAPTNEAFAKIPKDQLDALLKDKAALTRVLTYHVVAARVPASAASKLQFADTVSGQRAVIANSGGLTIAGAKITQTDIDCTNGVIHVIDTVMMPSSDDLVATAVKAGSFKTLATALEAAGLVSTLQGEGPFTVFAPTDEAFAKLGEKTIADLLKPENKAKLVSILTYHVVPGRVFSDQALKAQSAKTVQGQPVTIALKDGKAKVNDANLVKTDINATNGVIHVIDSVILPPEKK